MIKPKFYIVIDDDRINNMVCESVIKKLHEQNQVISFLRAEDALNYLKNNLNPKPDIIFLDINMPEMDGWEFLDNYLKLNGGNNAQIFMLSSSINQSDFDKAKKYVQVLDYIVKPFSKDKLVKAIEMTS
ncbi:response regulator [Raineya orbicola]|jgi:two-component SAPR family response regulator|uniref:Response regulator receiver domain n=1 Tax=Raineya orbicola TaxID=2016530 RepID=A0A2N3IJD7_9BACT|nr:response regulator [Raineya orbicola]PKQ70416.1 Response regulator receiver domain [Raineya orbicola]